MESWLRKQFDAHVFNKGAPINDENLSKINMLAALYFPELTDDIFKLTQTARNYVLITLDISKQLLSAQDDHQKLSILKNASTKTDPPYRSLLQTTHDITKKAAAIIKDIMNS